MQDWIAAQIDTGLAAFRGAQISGTVVVEQELLNEIIAEWLSTQSLPVQPVPTSDRQDFSGLMNTVTRLSLNAEAGAVSVHFEITV